MDLNEKYFFHPMKLSLWNVLRNVPMVKVDSWIHCRHTDYASRQGNPYWFFRSQGTSHCFTSGLCSTPTDNIGDQSAEIRGRTFISPTLLHIYPISLNKRLISLFRLKKHTIHGVVRWIVPLVRLVF